MKISANDPCPCGSGHKYKKCCRRFHHGEPAPNPATLMRSRFSAYATGLTSYIMDTTHPEGPMWQTDGGFWRQTIERFTAATRFVGLEVFGAQVEGDRGEVYFRAKLFQDGQDVSFVEHSLFLRRDGRWLYHSGQDE